MPCPDRRSGLPWRRPGWFRSPRRRRSAATIARDHGAVEDEAHERDFHLLLQREVGNARHAGHRRTHAFAEPPQRAQILSEHLDRDVRARPGQHVVDTVRIGCPMVTFVPGSVENSRRSAASSSSRGRSVSRKPTSISAASTLDVLVELRAPHAPRRRDDLGLIHQNPLDTCADLIGLAERRSRGVLACTVRLPSWKSAGTPCRRASRKPRQCKHDHRDRDNWCWVIQNRGQQSREVTFEHARQPTVVPTLDRRGSGRNA